ncbi:MAG TPA: FAD-dependent oxidoreductase [Blastocatellia bacterium]|nr:FAD-dependent oxidoreductase [Blastocatellia bacterium]
MSSDSIPALNADTHSVTNRPRIAILGAGPAGLGAAWQLARSGKAETIVLEQRSDVGGNSGSFDLDGLMLDYGSHRLHPSCHPEIMADLRSLLGEDLLDRPRHGRICLRGRWIHFPLKPVDLMLRLPISFATGVAFDSVRKLIPTSPQNGEASFASVLERNLGSTIFRDFYHPYAQKIWGVPAEQLSAIQAYRRVSAGSLMKMVKKVLALVPGFKAPGAGRFFYPRKGFGQISQALASAALADGAQLWRDTTVHKIHLGTPHRIEVQRAGVSQTIEADYVWSTIPITTLARLVNPAAPPEVIEAGRNIKFRAMILIYLVIGQSQFTEFDAHYFPDAETELTRISEPKNYSACTVPKDRTVLCCELPCDVDDNVWRMTDEELGKLASRALERSGLPIQAPILEVVTKRLSHAYPIYLQGYEQHFGLLDAWASQLDRVLTFGRQGLFAHDNTHHALAMAYAAVASLSSSGTFDLAQWADHRAEFATHTVED